MTDKVFVDSDLWIYLFSEEANKQSIVEKLINVRFDNIVISSQVLNEVYNILSKKLKVEKVQMNLIIREMIENFYVADIGSLEVLRAIDIKDKYNFSYWDSLIIASAIENDCNTLFTEDLQHNQVIENVLIVKNPFEK